MSQFTNAHAITKREQLSQQSTPAVEIAHIQSMTQAIGAALEAMTQDDLEFIAASVMTERKGSTQMMRNGVAAFKKAASAWGNYEAGFFHLKLNHSIEIFHTPENGLQGKRYSLKMIRKGKNGDATEFAQIALFVPTIDCQFLATEKGDVVWNNGMTAKAITGAMAEAFAYNALSRMIPA